MLLPKDPDDPADPMAYRVLKITSALYRLWAGVRLHHMRPWVQSWDDPALLAGTQGRSAQDGWYATALSLEAATVEELPLCGASLDIY